MIAEVRFCVTDLEVKNDIEKVKDHLFWQVILCQGSKLTSARRPTDAPMIYSATCCNHEPLVWILNPKPSMAGTADAVVKGQKVHTYLARSVIGPPMALLMDQIWSQTVTTTSFSDFMVLTRRFQGDWRRQRSRMVNLFLPTHIPKFLVAGVSIFSIQFPSFKLIFMYFPVTRHAKTSQVILHDSSWSHACQSWWLDTRNLKPFDAWRLHCWEFEMNLSQWNPNGSLSKEERIQSRI